MQTILGAGGAVGVELAKALKQYTDRIRLVSRHPTVVNPGDQLLAADLTDRDDVSKAVKGSEIVYLTVGLPYSAKSWEALWPKIMGNVISACRGEKARLVFFDNVYMYDPTRLAPMTENTPMRPASRKGRVRHQLVQMLMDEIGKGNLLALIARSADFYGPSIKNNSVLTETVFNNFSRGKKALWFSSVDCKHSFTFTPDAGQATALLGNTPDAFNQVWHLPTVPDPFTGREWIQAVAGEMGVTLGYRVVSKVMLKIIGLFKPVMRELAEMLYQYDRDYVFDSGKFEKRFGIKATPCLEGIKRIARRDYRQPK